MTALSYGDPLLARVTAATVAACEQAASNGRAGVPRLSAEAGSQRHDVVDVALGVVVHAARLDGVQALVVARCGEPRVATGLAHEAREVQRPGADVVFCGGRVQARGGVVNLR